MLVATNLQNQKPFVDQRLDKGVMDGSDSKMDFLCRHVFRDKMDFFFNARKPKPYWFLYEPKPKKKFEATICKPKTYVNSMQTEKSMQTQSLYFFHARKSKKVCKQYTNRESMQTQSLCSSRHANQKKFATMQTKAKLKPRQSLLQLHVNQEDFEVGKKMRQPGYSFFLFVLITC